MDDETNDVAGKGLKVAHLNVRSIMGGHKLEMVRNQIEGNSIDVFTMSESWLSKAIPDRIIECMNYNVVRLDWNWNDAGDGEALPKRGGGVLNFIKSNIKYSETRYEGLNVSCKNVEMLWVALDISNMRPVVVVTIYRPPQGDHKRCNTIINEAFERANLKDNTDIFLLGDFNVNFADKTHAKTRDLDFTTRALGLKQLIKSSTRTTSRNGEISESQLDLILSNSDNIANSGTLYYNISDHLAVLVTRKKRAASRQRVEFSGRSFKNYVCEDFQNDPTNLDWGPFYDSRERNKLWEFMEEKILQLVNRSCLIKKYKVRARREPWVTNEAIEAIKDKDRLLRKAKRSGKAEDWEIARRVRNLVGRDLENLRSDFLKRQQETYKNDPKKFWKNIAAIFPS